MRGDWEEMLQLAVRVAVRVAVKVAVREMDSPPGLLMAKNKQTART